MTQLEIKLGQLVLMGRAEIEPSLMVLDSDVVWVDGIWHLVRRDGKYILGSSLELTINRVFAEFDK